MDYSKVTIKPITAREARSLVVSYSATIQRFFEKVQEAIEEHKCSFIFSIYGKDLTAEEKEFLEELGYNINWDRSCLWYRASF